MEYDDDHYEGMSPETERYLKKYFKRTGIYRLYRINRPPSKSTLMLEFVVRGHVLGTVKLWKQKSLFS